MSFPVQESATIRQKAGVSMEFRVVVESQNNAFHAYCPNLKGCHSWGSTVEEAMGFIEEALQFYVDNVEEEEETDEMPEEFSYYTFPMIVN